MAMCSYSIWAMPKGAVAEKLQGEINYFGSKFHAPVFRPHVTITGGINLTQDEVLKQARDLASRIKVLIANRTQTPFESR